jgi:K+-sensing histidine kinase KdpD
VGEKVLGVIATYHPTQDYVYSSDDLEILQAMANQAAIALDNSHLFYDVNRRLEALVYFGQAVTSGIRLREDEVLNLIYEQASRLMDANNMYIALYDELTDTVRFGLGFVDGKPIDVKTEKGWEPRKAGKGRTEEIIRTKKPIFTATKAESEAWYAQPEHKEYIGGGIWASWLGVPMMVGEKVLGVIATYHPTQDYVYSSDDLEILQAMANTAAIAIDNARLYEEARKEVIAQKQLATLGTAMAALQHRINNSFNIIVPNVSRLRSRVDTKDATITEILDIIERNARYTSKIISRIQEPLREVESQGVNLNGVLTDIASEIKEQWETDSSNPPVDLILNLDDSIPLIQVPIGQVSEVFRNLTENGYRAMKKSGGRLEVVSQYIDDKIEVRVKDTGTGIPASVQQRLFVKPVPAKEPEGGSGLGLWLSQLMLQRISGEIKIEKSDSSGTTMLVRLMPSGYSA